VPAFGNPDHFSLDIPGSGSPETPANRANLFHGHKCFRIGFQNDSFQVAGFFTADVHL
jgi:hypothetical protein